MKLEKSGKLGVGANAAIAAEPPATTANVAATLPNIVPPLATMMAVVTAAEIRVCGFVIALLNFLKKPISYRPHKISFS